MLVSNEPKTGSRILSDKQKEKVHEYTLQLLEEIGCTIQCNEALEILKKAGCDVSNTSRVKIPKKVLMKALESAPKSIEVFNRDGETAMLFEEGNCHYGTGSDCVNTIDLDSGERRICTTEDIGRLARFCDALPNIDFVMSFGIAYDAPKGCNFVYQYEAMLLNTKKPIIVTGHGKRDMLTMVEMAGAAIGGVDKIYDRPPLILYTEPLSPLIHTEMGLAKGLICCEFGIPFIYIGSPMMGATGPATIEGVLVQTVAESLAGLVIFQNKEPGAKFIFGGDASILDMKHTQYSYGAPELQVLNAALADMAHYYKLPFFCIAGATDSKLLDVQAGMEYAVSLLNATLNRCNIIHDCGYLESGLTSSFESILLTDEIIGMIKYMLRPLDFNNKTVALDVINRLGPGGNFLEDDHTLENFRNVFWFPRFLNRQNYQNWFNAGGKDLRQELRIKSKQIFRESKHSCLPEQTEKEIRKIVSQHQPDL